MKSIESKKIERMQAIFSTTPPFPKEILLEPNNTCNHKCYFCAHSKMTRSQKLLDNKLCFQIMREAYDLGARNIGLHATGEPFMHPTLDKFVSETKKIGYEYVFIDSNGSLATPERAKPVIEAGLDSIKFSVNAGTAETYFKIHGKNHFNNVINNIIWFHNFREQHKLKFKIFVSTVQTNKNIGEWEILKNILAPFVDKFLKRHCSNQGGCMLENNRTENINKLNILGSRFNDQLDIPCTEPFNRLTISSEGYLSGCVVDYGNNLIIADLNRVSLKEAWHSDIYENF